MEIAIVNNGIVDVVGHYRSLFPQTSFSSSGPPASFLLENSCKLVATSLPHNRETHKLVASEPYLLDDTVYTVRVEPLSAEDIAQRTAAKSSEVRSQRDALLNASDWTQLQDCPKQNQGAWRQYRQALRDLPQQPGFPDATIWPTPPGAA